MTFLPLVLKTSVYSVPPAGHFVTVGRIGLEPTRLSARRSRLRMAAKLHHRPKLDLWMIENRNIVRSIATTGG
jgi:hypothetical protein